MIATPSEIGSPSIQWAAIGYSASARSHVAVSRSDRSSLSLALVTKPTPQVPLSAGRVRMLNESWWVRILFLHGGTLPSAERKCRP